LKYFAKMNVFALLACIPLVVFAQLEVNVYRISRVTGLDLDIIVKAPWIAFLIAAVLGLILFPFYIRKHLGRYSVDGWLLILWIPYFFLFAGTIGRLLPVMHPGEDPGPGTGMLLLFVMFFYPIYVLMTLMFAQFKWDFGVEADQ